MKYAPLTRERLTELLDYNVATGVFVWKKKNSVAGPDLTGVVAGVIHKGYRIIGIDKKNYRAARLAWLYVTGRWPSRHVDHKNCIKDDDRFENLREATPQQNAANHRAHCNNKSGFKGVRRRHGLNLWSAHIRRSNRTVTLGYFKTPEEANAAYREAAERAFGEFARAE